MSKTIFITGSTDGIGLVTAGMLAAGGHRVLLHGRSQSKLEQAQQTLADSYGATAAGSHLADLSDLRQVDRLADALLQESPGLDVLINNAGVFHTSQTRTADGLDIRFVVNTFAPVHLSRRLLPQLDMSARIVNLSSAAQSPVSLAALAGEGTLSDFEAYAQSKLALTMWSRSLGLAHRDTGPVIVAVNPASMLGSKMVKQAFGVDGGDLRIGADILIRAALSDEFAGASGQYFDNDSGRFATPHADALDDSRVAAVLQAIDNQLARLLGDGVTGPA